MTADPFGRRPGARRWALPLLAGAACAAGLLGCNTAGPKSLAAGRSAYNQVINQTEDEQILGLIVRERYDETFGMLGVAAVTASIRIAADAGVNVGIGDDDAYDGNLVPFSAGVAYEENPTISYVPLGGETFARRMTAPLTLPEMMTASAVIADASVRWSVLIDRVNGLGNPALGEQSPPGFDRASELWTQLVDEDVIDTAFDGQADGYDVLLHDYFPDHVAELSELLTLLGLGVDLQSGNSILVPLRRSVALVDGQGINIETPSVLSLIQRAGAAIQVPGVHLEAGLVEPTQARDPYMTIRSSRERPEEATVAVLFKDWWFYIDATDRHAKRGFKVLRTLIGMRLYDDSGGKQAPVLTIPVGG